MKALARLFCWAISISCLGTLPLGTLNLSVANYAYRHDLTGALSFSLAAIFVEVTLVGVALSAVRRLERLTRFFRVFNLLTCGILLLLAFNSLLAAWQMEAFRASLPFAFLSPVPAGLLLSLTNPLHLPFWMGWTAFLRSKKVLDDSRGSYITYLAAIASGTGLAFCIYGFAGSSFVALLGSRQVLLNWIVGFALLAAALVQIYRTFFKKWTFVEAEQ